MRNYHLSVLILCLLVFPFYSIIFAQEGSIRGKVVDASSGERLPGVNIIIDKDIVTASSTDGSYSHSLSAGEHSLVFKFIGYAEKTIIITLDPGKIVTRDVYLQPTTIELNPAVVSASRYEQRLSDVIVSMEVLPASLIESVNTYMLDETISMLPGVDVIDGQANIRGGSGYTYGAGSRVLVLLDGLPILSGGVGDVKWNSLPTEIVGQVEVIKGASSALYGTSALNGVINLRTATPGIKPETSIDLSMGMFTKPDRKELAWFWERNPFFGRMNFSHLQKAGPVDIVIGGSGLYDEGYRQDNDMKYGRLDAGLRYTPSGIGGLSLGMNAGYQLQALTDFLIWQDADSGGYIQNPQAITPMHGYRLNIDPYVSYYDGREGRHYLRTRYYQVINQFSEDEDKDNNSDVYYGEYQYYRKFIGKLNLTAGAAFSYSEGRTSLYGNHFGSTQALYAQFDYSFTDRLSTSLGMRWERYTLDRSDDDDRPVFRAGLNYHFGKSTFVRASFGQGFRYPSMAEKYTSTGLGGLKIFPNTALEPETGWSAEIGIRQGFASKTWNTYIDLAAYWMEYDNMIEFIFGVYNPPGEPATIDHVGFKSVNTGRARINGIDVSFAGQGKAGPFMLKFFAGYTYMNPLDLTHDTTFAESADEKILKYRYHHAVKTDISLQYRMLDLGITGQYRSFMERIDEAFEEPVLGQYFFPGLKDYRKENNKGALILDLRLGWQVGPASKISLHIKNLFNKESMGRPGDLQPPRNISLQYVLKIGR